MIQVRSQNQQLQKNYIKSKQKIDPLLLEKLIPNGYGYVWLSNNRWNQYGIPNCILYIQQWKVRECLSLESNFQVSILNQIKDIAFPNLQTLQLYKNNIQSIEVLCNIYMPNLKQIYLSTNHISDIRILRKCNWPSLAKISLHCNHIKELNTLKLMQFSKLEWLYVELYQTDSSDCADLSWVFKLNCQNLQWLPINSKKRLGASKKYIQQIKKKYNKIQILKYG